MKTEQEIRDLFDNGIAIWVDPKTLLTEIDKLRSEIKELKHAVQCGLKGLIWYIEGPYGDSPSLSDLQIVRKILNNGNSSTTRSTD